MHFAVLSFSQMCGIVLFASERRRKKVKSSNKVDSKLRPNYFIAVQITNLDVSCGYLFAATINATK